MGHSTGARRLGVTALAVTVALVWPMEGLGHAAAAAATAQTGCGTAASYRQQWVPCEADDPPPYQPPPQVGGGDDWVKIAILVIATAAIACIATKCLSKDTPSAEKLLDDGPQLPDNHPAGVGVAYGFVRNNWPIVLDYVAQEDANTWLTITVGKKSWKVPVGNGRQQLTFPFEGGFAETATPALFTLESYGPDGALIPVQMLAIGCGPRAVGSVAINNLRFARGPGGAFASYSYKSEATFSRVQDQVLRFTSKRDSKGVFVITTQAVAQLKQNGQPPGPYGPRAWDGRDNGRQPSIGLHRVRVRGWETDQDQSWVATTSFDAIRTQ